MDTKVTSDSAVGKINKMDNKLIYDHIYIYIYYVYKLSKNTRVTLIPTILI